MTKEQIKEKAKDFVSKIAGGTSKEMDYYANILAEFATEVTKELETSVSNLRKDNKELREVLPKLDKENDELKYKLTKAKEIIKQLMKAIPYGSGKLATEAYDKAEQFLKGTEE